MPTLANILNNDELVSISNQSFVQKTDIDFPIMKIQATELAYNN